MNADKVGIEAAEMLLANLRHGGTVDEYLQDQVMTMTLSGSKPSFLLALSIIMLNTNFFNCGIKIQTLLSHSLGFNARYIQSRYVFTGTFCFSFILRWDLAF